MKLSTGIRWLFIPFLCMAVALTGCSFGSGSGDQEQGDVNSLEPLSSRAKVIVAEDGAASGAGFYIAKDRGYFDQYNIDVEFTTFANSDDMLPALAGGSIDIAGGIATASFFNSIAQGIDVKMIADKGHNNPGSSYFTFVIGNHMVDKIKNYSDFKGKRVAVSSKNGVDHYIYMEMLKHAGLQEKDVEFVLMSDFGNMMAAIGNGSIDAALQIEPLITQGVEQGIHVRFGDATDFAPKAQIAMVLASPEFLTERRDVAVRFMAAYLQGIRDYNDVFVKKQGDKDEIIRIMTEYTALKDAAIWEKVAVTGLDPNGAMYVEDIKHQYTFYDSNGGIVGDVDFDDAVDTSLAEKAVELLGEYK
jgi:NitT/TauT family transport system substrate-binding protein